MGRSHFFRIWLQGSMKKCMVRLDRSKLIIEIFAFPCGVLDT
jgi:hypothetical protein